MIHFNSPDHVQERANVEPLSLAEATHAVETINQICSMAGLVGGNIALGFIQRLVWEYENLKHASMTAPKWINVEDALPEPYDESFIVYPNFDMISYGTSICFDEPCFYIFDEYYDRDMKVTTVTHWMPLPTPPNTK